MLLVSYLYVRMSKIMKTYPPFPSRPTLLESCYNTNMQVSTHNSHQVLTIIFWGIHGIIR